MIFLNISAILTVFKTYVSKTGKIFQESNAQTFALT